MILLNESFSSYDPQSGEYTASIDLFGDEAELYGEVNCHLVPNVGTDRLMFGNHECEEVTLELSMMVYCGEEITDQVTLNLIKEVLNLCQN